MTATVRLPPAIHVTPNCIVLLSYTHENKIRHFQLKNSVSHKTLKEVLDEVKKTTGPLRPDSSAREKQCFRPPQQERTN